MKINPFYSIAKTQTIQNFSTNLSKPKNAERLNTYLPIAESAFITSLYIYNTNKSRDIPKENKKFLMINDALTSICATGISLLISNKMKKMTDNICNNILKSDIMEKEKVSRGIKICTPLIITSLIFRYLVPVISSPISSYLKERRKQDEDKRFNKNA